MPITSDEVASRVEGQTLTNLFARTVDRHGDRTALRWKDAAEAWHELTFREYADQACAVAGALADLGVRAGDRVALMMRNRHEFHIADVAALLLGATPVSIYNSSAPEQIEYLLGHCEAGVVIVEDTEYLERVLKVRSELPKLEHVAIIDDPDGLASDDVVSYSSLVTHAPVDFTNAAGTAGPDDLLTIIYTSGTTGPPKGVALTHFNGTWTAESLRILLEDVYAQPRRVISYLPMAHIAERTTSHYVGMIHGMEVTTCPDASRIAQYIGAVKPEVFFAVPRVYEKFYSAIQAMAGADPERKAAFDEAIAIGAQAAEYRANGEKYPSDFEELYNRIESEALQPVRELLGVDDMLLAITGAAPIPVETFNFFRGLGLPLAEIYGLSETSGPMTFTPYAVRPGTVGQAIPGEDVILADDGEVLCRGGNVFGGYLNDPDKTAEVLDSEGWFHTGDIGELDADGYLSIVDRKKELIITAGGKNISPSNLEAELKSSHALISQCAVIGDNRPFVSALLVLDPEMAPVWAKQRGIECTTLAALAEHPEVMAAIEVAVHEANEKFSQVEKVKKFTIIGEEWQPDSKLLTPTMKLKRRGVHEHYEREIEEMYSG